MADKEIKEAKSLRWLANQFPKIENPKDNGDRLCNCINLYCTNAAELIEKLHKENEIKNSKRANIFEIVDAFKRGKAEAYKEVLNKVRILRNQSLINKAAANRIEKILIEMAGE